MSNEKIRHTCVNIGVLVVYGAIRLVVFVVFDWTLWYDVNDYIWFYYLRRRCTWILVQLLVALGANIIIYIVITLICIHKSPHIRKIDTHRNINVIYLRHSSKGINWLDNMIIIFSPIIMCNKSTPGTCIYYIYVKNV